VEFEGFKDILVPVDFSTVSNKAYIYALEMIRRMGGRLHVLHVLDTDFLTGAVHITIEPLDESVAKWRKRAEEKLNKLYHKDDEEGLDIQIHLREGLPHEEILKAAEEIKTDLIIMGSHGRQGLERAIFGSVAEKVVRTADTPLMLIKP